MKLKLQEFFDQGGPGGHAYNKGDVATLMGVSRQTLHQMLRDKRPVFVYLKGGRVVGIREKGTEKIWYSEG